MFDYDTIVFDIDARDHLYLIIKGVPSDSRWPMPLERKQRQEFLLDVLGKLRAYLNQKLTPELVKSLLNEVGSVHLLYKERGHV